MGGAVRTGQSDCRERLRKKGVCVLVYVCACVICVDLPQVVFFQGVSPSLRKEVWPFLLGVYKFDSTLREREIARLENCRRYWTLDDKRLARCLEILACV